MNAELLVDCRNILGEGIRWHVPTQRLYWVDIQQALLLSCDADGQHLQRWQLDERIAAFSFTASDRLLVALASGFAYFYPESGRIQRLNDFEPTKVTTRLNDGTTDRDGNFICGGMDELRMERISSVIQLKPDGRQRTLLEAVGCTNSLALSRDGRKLYFADTSGDSIFCFDYDAAKGEIRNGRIFTTLAKGTGRPDGSTIDSEDQLWNAHWGGSCVTRYGLDGTPERTISLPVSQVTCCTFGGPALDRLYITTAREHLSKSDLERQPLAGGVFVCRPGCQGLVTTNYGG